MLARLLPKAPFALALAIAFPCVGATVTLVATDSGFYSQAGLHTPANQNYLTGLFGDERRSFFVFDLSSVSGTVNSARLRLYNPQVNQLLGYVSPDPTETLNIYDVAASAAAVTGGTAGVGGFADLGSGTLFGSRSVSAADNGTVVEIILNASAVAALDSSSGLFLFGGALGTLSGAANEYVFGFSTVSFVPDDVRELVLEVTPDQGTLVPEPSTIQVAVLALLARRAAGLGRR